MTVQDIQLIHFDFNGLAFFVVVVVLYLLSIDCMERARTHGGVVCDCFK